MNSFKDLLMQFAKKAKEKVPYLAVGLIYEKVVINSFDYILYPFMIWKYGLLKGGIIMSFFSAVICYATLIVYDWTKKDWFGIEWVKELKEYSGPQKSLRTMSWILGKGKIAIMIFLSLYTNPFTTTAYMREGINKFNGMDRKSWQIFFISWFIGNFEWMLVSFAGVSVIKIFLKFFNLNL